MTNTIPLMEETPSINWDGKDGEFFSDLFQVFKRHHMVDRFGLYMLHRHFDVHDTEVMVETNDRTARQSVVAPIQERAVSRSELIETAWKFDEHGNRKVLQYCGRCGR